MAAVHAIEIADGQGAGGGNARVVKTPKNFHGESKDGLVIVLIANKSQTPVGRAGFVMETGYIVTQRLVVLPTTGRCRDLQSVLVVMNR